MEKIRLQKYLASCGIASRRKCEEIILSGKVKVNDAVASLGMSVDPDYDKIYIDNIQVNAKNKKIYIMFNKPVNCLTTVSDDRGRQTVIDILKRDINERIFPVGRLDMNTEGLLLLTNDGEFADMVMHPRFRVPKTYIATVGGGPVSLKELSLLKRGVPLEDGITQPSVVNVEGVDINGNCVISITITEGRKRQVRRMFKYINHPVLALKRVSVGNIKLGNLPYGKWRHLRQEEINSLLRGQYGK